MGHDGKKLGAWMAFIMYVGAARADASPPQLRRLRKEVVPTINKLKGRDAAPEDTKSTLIEILKQVQGIMGKEWKPQGEWMRAIDSLLPKGGGHGRQAQ